MRWGIGAAAGGRLWLALGVESHRVYCSSASAFGWVDRGVVEAGVGNIWGPRLRRHHAHVAAAGEESDGDEDAVVTSSVRCDGARIVRGPLGREETRTHRTVRKKEGVVEAHVGWRLRGGATRERAQSTRKTDFLFHRVFCNRCYLTHKALILMYANTNMTEPM